MDAVGSKMLARLWVRCRDETRHVRVEPVDNTSGTSLCNHSPIGFELRMTCLGNRMSQDRKIVRGELMMSNQHSLNGTAGS